MISADIDDYVVVRTQNNKSDLFKLVSRNKETGNFYGVREKQRMLDHVEHVDLEAKNIIANLGKTPIMGSVFGHSTELYRKKSEVEGYGTVYYYRKLTKEDRIKLRKALTECRLKLEKLKIKLHPFDTEIRESKGKWSGFFKFRPSKKEGKSTDLLCLKPNTFDGLPFLVYHELGHAIWFRRTTVATKARWILAYHKAVTLQKVKAKDINSVLNGFFESKSFCKEYSKTLDEVENSIFEQCLDYVADKHLLDTKHLDTLIAGGKDIGSYFNVEDLKLQNVELLLTEYAKEKPEEFFAEAVALHLSGTILPKSLRDLMDNTLRKAAHYIEREDDS